MRGTCNLTCEAGRRTGTKGELDQKVAAWADRCVCAPARAFLINTTMKVGCVEAMGTSERLLVAAHVGYTPFPPPNPHYIHHTVPDVFRKKLYQ